MQRLFLLSCCIICCLHSVLGADNLRLVKQWAELDFVFPNKKARLDAIQKRYFVPGKSVPIDVDVDYRIHPRKSRIFVTVSRTDEGRAVTLGRVDEQGRIVPYPDYSWHERQGSNCDGMTSVFRVEIDRCKRLWVMDTGRISKQSCPPQLLAFSLDRDELLYRHRVEKKNCLDNSLYVTPVVDIPRTKLSPRCQNTFVYVADVTGYGILVVDVENNRSRRGTHKLFFPYPNRSTFTIDGESFDLLYGVLGMTLSPVSPDDRFLYFHALASTTENFISTSVLKNESLIHDPNIDRPAKY